MGSCFTVLFMCSMRSVSVHRCEIHVLYCTYHEFVYENQMKIKLLKVTSVSHVTLNLREIKTC